AKARSSTTRPPTTTSAGCSHRRCSTPTTSTATCHPQPTPRPTMPTTRLPTARAPATRTHRTAWPDRPCRHPVPAAPCGSSVARHSSVDGQGRAGDVRGCRARQEHDRRVEFPLLAQPAEGGGLLDERKQLLVRDLRRHLAREVPRCD